MLMLLISQIILLVSSSEETVSFKNRTALLVLECRHNVEEEEDPFFVPTPNSIG